MVEDFIQVVCGQCESQHYTVWMGDEVLHLQCAICKVVSVVETSGRIYIPVRLVKRHPSPRPLLGEEELA